MPTNEGPIEVAIIAEPRIPAAVLIDAASGDTMPQERLDRVTWSIPSFEWKTGVNAPPPPGIGTPSREDLGSALIEGLPCRGERAVYEDGTIEHWRAAAEDLGQPIVMRVRTAADDFEARLRDVRLVDPDPNLLEPLERTLKRR